MTTTGKHIIRTRSTRVLHHLGRALMPHPRPVDRAKADRRAALNIQQAPFRAICR